MGSIIHSIQQITRVLVTAQLGPDKWWLEDNFPFEMVPFQVTCSIFGGENNYIVNPLGGQNFLIREHTPKPDKSNSSSVKF